jgi:hypothetical protein
MGVTLGLPVLDAMVPAFASELAGPDKAMRLAFAYVPNGIVMESWTPASAGTGFGLPGTLRSLEPFRENLLVLSGLAHHNGEALGDGGGDHARAGATFLTGVHPKKTMGADIHLGISVDQIAAQAIGSKTRLSSLELGCEDTRTVGNCDTGYSCSYTNSISWRTATSPMPPETNPRLVFERLFGTLDTSLDPAARARLSADRRSVLDFVGDRTRRLTVSLGASDRRKVDEYLYAVRDVERRIQSAESDSNQAAPTIEKPSGIPLKYSDYAKLMFDLQALAFQADITRVATLVFSREASSHTYPELGIDDGHHPLSHHRGNKDNIEKLKRINAFHVSLFGHFLEKLKNTPDGDGSLLDHSMIAYGSSLSDGNKHLHNDLPVLLAGGGNGSLRPGRHVVYEKDTPMTNLYMSMLDHMGVHPESIGDSTGKVAHLSDL